MAEPAEAQRDILGQDTTTSFTAEEQAAAKDFLAQALADRKWEFLTHCPPNGGGLCWQIWSASGSPPRQNE